MSNCCPATSGAIGQDLHTRPGAAQSDWIYMGLVFLSLAIAPLLSGAILIVAGLT